MSESFVPLTPGSGAYKVATYRFSFGGEDREISRFSLNDATGAELKGQKLRGDSLPISVAVEDLAALKAADPAAGFVAVPASGASALAQPTASIVITLAGNLGVKMADGSDNNAKLIPVIAGMVFPFQVVQLTAANTAGVLGLIHA